MPENKQPNILVHAQGPQVRIVIICDTDAEATAYVQLVREHIQTHGYVNIRLGTAEDVIEVQEKAS